MEKTAMIPKLYKHKTSARAAAVKALGPEAEFELIQRDDGQWYWIDTSAAAAEAAGAENDPPPQPEPVAEISVLEAESAENNAPPAPEPAAEISALEPPVAFEEPEEKANLTVDLGLTPELVALIYGLGEAAGDAIPVPQKRRGITAKAWEAVYAGKLPEPLAFPASNAHAQKHADTLLELAAKGDEEALANYPIGGTNTYSKALRDFRDALFVYLDGGKVEPMQEAA
jgi:hypothetical protein